MLNSNERIIKHKVGLLNLAEELGNVSQACKVMGLSRDTFYRYKSAVEEGGVDALLDATRRKPNLKNRTDEVTETAVCLHAVDFPAHGQLRTSNELRRIGVFICLAQRCTQCLAAPWPGLFPGPPEGAGGEGGPGRYYPDRRPGGGSGAQEIRR